MTLDPRCWSLGFALALGCVGASTGVGQGESTTESGASASSEASSADSSEASTGAGSDESDEGCACADDDDCGLLQACTSCACVAVGAMPEPCEGAAWVVQMIAVAEPEVAVVFADLDVDGAQELVVVDYDSFTIHRHDSDTPLVVLRAEPAFPGWVGAGAFDLDPGEDILAFQGSGLVLNSADGVGGIDKNPASFPFLAGGRALKVGEIDGRAPEDLLETTDAGAFEILGSGAVVELTSTSSFRVALLDQTHPQTGIAIDHGSYLSRFSLDGSPLGDTALASDWLVGASLGEEGYFLSAEARGAEAWYWLRWIDAATGAIAFEQGFETTTVDGAPRTIEWYPADLNGDGRDDEVLVSWLAPWGVSLWLDAPGGCLLETDLSLDVEIFDVAIGDHDGDGDEEFAVVVASGEVAILDYEG